MHYLWLSQHGVLYLVFAYGKDEQSRLAADQKKQLKAIVEQIKAEWDQG